MAQRRRSDSQPVSQNPCPLYTTLIMYIATMDGLIVEAWGLEDTSDRLRQLRQDNEQDQEASPGV